MEGSEYSEMIDLEETFVTHTQKIFSSLYSEEFNTVVDYCTLNIKIESSFQNKIGELQKQKQKHSSSMPKKASHVFTENSFFQIQVKYNYTVWMVKVKLFEKMNCSFGFNPPSVSLFLYPNLKELNNSHIVEEIGINAGDTLLAVPSMNPGSSKKTFLRSKSEKCYSKLSFAVGRGLNRGVVGKSCIFSIYSVNRSERYTQRCDEKFNLHFQLIRNNIDQTSNLPPPTIEEFKQDKFGRTNVTFIPNVAGDYCVHIFYKKDPICLSPFELTVINVEKSNSGIREMAFCGWQYEAASMISKISKDYTQHELIFSVGMPALLNLFGSTDDYIQKHMNRVLSNLLEIEENQIRIAKEGSIQFVNKILKNPYWLKNERICKFIGRVLSFALETNTVFRKQFLKKFGVESLLSLAYSNSTESIRYAVKSLFIISKHSDNISNLIKHGLFIEAIIHLLNFDDIIVKRYCLHTFFNLTKSEVFTNSLNQRKLNLLVNHLSSSDRRLQLDVLIILSQVNSNLLTKSFIETDIFNHLFNCITIESIIQWWDIICYNNNDNIIINSEYIDNLLQEHLSQSETKLQSDLNTVTLRYINGVLSNANSNEIGNIINILCTNNNGELLNNICVLAGCIEIRIQREACKILSFISEVSNYGKNIIDMDGILWLLGNFNYIDIVKQKYIFGTLSRISHFFDNTTTLPEESLINFFIIHSKSPDKYLQDHSIIILANLSKNSYYRDKYFINNSKLLMKIINSTRNLELSLQPTYIEWNQLQILDEIDYECSLYTISTCTLNGVTYSMKKYNINNLKFNYNDFLFEIATMSLLNHNNIISIVGASSKKPHLFIITKYYPKKSLYYILKSKSNLTLDNIYSILIGISKGMKYLHKLNILHRQLSPNNILVDDDFNIVITNFASSRVEKKNMTPDVGDTPYISPDLIDSSNYTKKTDIYSFAILMWELTERKEPFYGLSSMEIVDKVQTGERLEISDDSPFKNIITSCWNHNANERPSFTNIIKLLEEIPKNINQNYSLPKPKHISISPLANKNISINIEVASSSLLNENTIDFTSSKPRGKLRSLKHQTSKKFDKMREVITPRNSPTFVPNKKSDESDDDIFTSPSVTSDSEFSNVFSSKKDNSIPRKNIKKRTSGAMSLAIPEDEMAMVRNKSPKKKKKPKRNSDTKDETVERKRNSDPQKISKRNSNK